MYCGKCGAQCNDNAKFCPKCGAELKKPDYTQNDDTTDVVTENISETDQHL